MAANVSFDPVAKIITVTQAPVSGIVELDVKIDLYSDGKEDWKTNASLTKFRFPIRAVGGNPLPGSKSLGSTFFLLYGWKIRPYGASHTMNVNGNLYSEDGTSPYIAALGTFSIAVVSSVSSLVDSTVQQLPEIEYASFDGRITIDTVSGTAGTAYPIGTRSSPVNNLTDALSIAVTRGIKVIETISALTITTGQNVSGFLITSPKWSTVTLNAGSITNDTAFSKVSLYGVMSGYWNVLNDCWIYNISNFIGWVRAGSVGSVSCGVGDIGAEFGSQIFFDDIVPLYPNVKSTVTMNTNITAAFTNCKDNVILASLGSTASVNVGLLEGTLTIASSCVGGSIIVTGVGQVTNNSALTPNVTGLVNPATVSDAAWDELLTEHTTVGTAGKKLKDGLTQNNFIALK